MWCCGASAPTALSAGLLRGECLLAEAARRFGWRTSDGRILAGPARGRATGHRRNHVGATMIANDPELEATLVKMEKLKGVVASEENNVEDLLIAQGKVNREAMYGWDIEEGIKLIRANCPEIEKLLKEITPLCEKIVISFATKSMIKQDKFKVNRKWIIDFIKENLMGPNSLRILDELVKNEKFAQGMRILDLGCGKGLTSIYLARKFEPITVFATDLWIEASENYARFKSVGLETWFEWFIGGFGFFSFGWTVH
jgi:hypothetical protein